MRFKNPFRRRKKPVSILAKVGIVIAWFSVMILTNMLAFYIYKKLMPMPPLQSLFQFKPPIGYRILTEVFLAPIWESLFYFVLPIQLLLLAGKEVYKKLIIWVVLGVGLYFGWSHGGAIQVIFQGIDALIFFYVYTRTRFCIICLVAVHALWNAFCIINGL